MEKAAASGFTLGYKTNLHRERHAREWRPLPPEGPYLTKFAVQGVIDTLNEALEALNLAHAEGKLEDVKAAITLARDAIQAKVNALQEV